MRDSQEKSPLIVNDPESLRSSFESSRQANYRRRLILVVLVSTALGAGAIGALAVLTRKSKSEKDIDRLIRFLKKSIQSIKIKDTGEKIPRSFDVNKGFWQYVCELENCDLHTAKGRELQTERIMATYGQNIYDAATWMVAMSLTGNTDRARKQLSFLLSDISPDGNQYSTLRAVSDPDKPADETFTYGYNETRFDKENAYFFRMLGESFYNTDPITGEVKEWVDWKPITGENAWATLIAPLQLAYHTYNGLEYIPLSDPAVALAIDMLPTFKAMQSPLGAIYYTTTDVAPNSGDGKVNPYSVSMENNFSTLAGLQMLAQVLEQHDGDKVLTRKNGQTVTVNAALEELNTLIEGIKSFARDYAFDHKQMCFLQGGLASDPRQPSNWLPNVEPFAVDVQTWGLSVLGADQVDEWFGEGTAYKIWQTVKEQAAYYPEGENTIAGVGYSNKPAPIDYSKPINVSINNENGNQEQSNAIRVVAIWANKETTLLTDNPIDYRQTREITIPTTQPKGSSKLKQLQFIDPNNNQVAIINVDDFNDQAQLTVRWQQVNAKITNYTGEHTVQSAEWTYGAILMTERIATEYKAIGKDDLAQALFEDADAMRKGVEQLYSNQYNGIPKSAMEHLPHDQLGVLYANRNYFIPFGWYARPMLSGCSGSWAVMANAGDQFYNPFVLGGNLTGTPALAQNPHALFQQQRQTDTAGTIGLVAVAAKWMGLI